MLENWQKEMKKNATAKAKEIAKCVRDNYGKTDGIVTYWETKTDCGVSWKPANRFGRAQTISFDKSCTTPKKVILRINEEVKLWEMENSRIV